MNEIINLIKKIKDTQEQEKIKNELIDIYNYKIMVLSNKENSNEVDNFIKKIIDEYRNKIETSDYYNSKEGDQLGPNRFETLCLIEQMIYNYVKRKVLKELIKNKNV